MYFSFWEGNIFNSAIFKKNIILFFHFHNHVTQNNKIEVNKTLQHFKVLITLLHVIRKKEVFSITLIFIFLLHILL